ncbi:MAG TPA: phosphopentomutase [Firmicutes bacterium]|jgi:phosphopentomutase|nr:phosphopentomutase [Bacillota bacterium]HOQ24027.1 phosphopentomutase [Bacillota bacterium]HPT67425.1 phosphopentomutase [Bacillota bacterium]
MEINRVFLVVLDGVGCGELPDATDYGDAGSNTLVNTARAIGGLSVPFLAELGLGRIVEMMGVPAVSRPQGSFGKMAEVSGGKDTITGHWEIAGIISPRPFPTYPHGFPATIIERFAQAIGRRVLGNRVASGTVIIEELGREHLQTGAPIVYTSADSVFQIAAHEDVIPLPELYRICGIARELLQGEHRVARVIARPFTGTPGNFQRTPNRRDFAVDPPGETLLDAVKAAGLRVWAVGKIEDIFNFRGITDSIHSHDNRETMDALEQISAEDFKGLFFANFIDFDMVYGHRNDPVGFGRALTAVDLGLGRLAEKLGSGDVLIITADHGGDPTTPSTDHSREYVPLLVAGQAVKAGVDLGVRKSFADINATIREWFNLPPGGAGESFAGLLRIDK